MRIIPAILLFILGIINIISVLTPAIQERLGRLQNFLPINIITASNYFVFAAGLFLLVTSAFMLKGLRMAWYFAISLCFISALGHLTKAIDYEEATISFAVIIILILSRKEYYIKHNPRLQYIGIQATLLAILATLVYGVIGFYFLDKKHFNTDFSALQSVKYTLLNFFLLDGDKPVAGDQFARDFIVSINVGGLISLIFLVYTLVRPYVLKPNTEFEDFERARILVEKYGQSSLDYFKLYTDKLIYLPDPLNCFLAYKVSGNFAIVLENPVASCREKAEECITLFDRFCYETGTKSLYYRVPENSLRLYRNKKKLFLGQEAVVNLLTFSLQGKSKKSLRNSCKKVEEKGFACRLHNPPHPGRLMEKVKAVSDEWLKDTGRHEIVFSQGMFIADVLKDHEILTVEDAEEKVVAFVNIIPDYVEGEGTYDLARKTADAPPGVMDFLMIKLFEYLKSKGCTHVNLGFAPLSGLKDPTGFPERSMKFAYEKIRSFSGFRGIREFKQKFDPVWYNRYLIYDQDFDLLQVPKALARVIKP